MNSTYQNIYHRKETIACIENKYRIHNINLRNSIQNPRL